MTLDAGILQSLTTGTPKDAWRVIVDQAIEIASKPLAAGNAPSEVTKRDREIGTLDHFLSSSGWDLWQAFGNPEISGIERTSDRLVRWWSEPGYAGSGAKAVLIAPEIVKAGFIVGGLCGQRPGGAGVGLRARVSGEKGGRCSI